MPGNLYAQTTILMPEPGVMIGKSAPFVPPVIKGISIHPEQPFYFDFLVDKGDSNLDEADFKNESVHLIKYFMASLAVPENDLWVNLSPHEKDRIIPEKFGLTDMGRDLLAQDYLLKQFTASLMYPENDLGKQFWNRVYKKAYQKYGTTDIPMDTFNKVWILPEKAVVYEKDNTAFIVESSLKVMLEEDYRSISAIDKKYFNSTSKGQTFDNLETEIVKEILIPEIEREVNDGKNFAQLRQIYHSLILATWYKENIGQSIVNQVYSDQNKIEGIDLEDRQSKIKIYNQYLEAFKKGVYNYIREDYDQYKDQVIPRQYFSGGMKIKPTIIKAASFDATTLKGDMAMISVRFDLANGGRIIDERSAVIDQAQTVEAKEQAPVRLADVNDLYAHIMGQLWDPLTIKPYSRGKFADLGKKWNDQWTQAEYDRYRSLPAQLMLFTWYDAQENKVLQFEKNLAALIDTAFDDEKLKAYWARGIKTIYHLRFQGNHPENFQHEYLDHYILQDTLEHYVALLMNYDPQTVPLEYLWGLVAMLDPMIYHPHFLKDNWNKDGALVMPAEEAKAVMHDKTRALMSTLLARFDRDQLTRLIQRAFSITPEQWETSGFRSPYADFANDNGGFFFLFRKIGLNPDETLDQIFLLARSKAYVDKHVTFINANESEEKAYLFAQKRAIADVEPNALLDSMRKIVSTVTEKIEYDPSHYYQMVYGSEFFRQATGVKFEFIQPQAVHETDNFDEIRDIVVAWHNRGLKTMYMTKMTKEGGVDLNTYWKNLKLFYIGDKEHPKSILIAGTNHPDGGNMLHIELMATDPQFEGRGYIKKLLATIVERYRRDYEVGGVFLFDDIDYLKEIGFKYERGEYRYSSPNVGESVQQKDEAMIARVDLFIDERAKERDQLFQRSPGITADKARFLSLQWRSAIMKAWYDGETIVHTDDELGVIGERMNALWKESGLDRYGSWPVQMMLLGVRQLTEEKYFNFVQKQDALISRASNREKLTAYWLDGVRYVSHLRYYGNHPEGHFEKQYADNEILIDVARKYIALLAQEDIDTLPLEYLWGLVAMLDPLVHNPDFRLDNWDEVTPKGAPESMMYDNILRIFEGLKFQGVDQGRLKELLARAFGMSDQQWAAAGFRSPYVEFAGFNFNLSLGDMFDQFYLKSDSTYTSDPVFLLARPRQFFSDNFNFVFNTRDPDRIKEFLFSNKRYEEPRGGLRHIFTNMTKTVVLEAVKKDPRYYYRQVYGAKTFQTATGFDHLGDILGDQKDAAILGKKPTDEDLDRFISSSQIGAFFDFVDSIDLPQGSKIKMIGSAETPQLGMAFALNGYDVHSITLDLKGTTIEETYQELLTDNIEAAGGHYRVFADTNYLDLPGEEKAPVMITALNVLDDPKTVDQEKMIEKMFQEVAEGGYLVFDFVLDREEWYTRIEAYAHQNGYLLETLYKMPIRGTVYKVAAKPALADAAMFGLERWEKVADVSVLRGGKDGYGSPPEESLALVTEEGEISTKSASKAEVHRQGLWHMTSHIYIFDSRGRLLLQKRSLQKSSSPGKLQVSVSGHVNAGESPKQAAMREGQEEMGILIDQNRLREVSAINAMKRSYMTEEGPNNEFTTVYAYTATDEEIAQITKNYNLNESDELWLIPPQTFEDMIQQDPRLFSQSLLYITSVGRMIYETIKSDHGTTDEAMFSFLRKNYRVLKRAMGGKEVTLENLKGFIDEKLQGYPLTDEWTKVADFDLPENDIVRRAAYEWMRLKGEDMRFIKHEMLQDRLYVRLSDRRLFFKKTYDPRGGGENIIGGDMPNVQHHQDFNDPLREALGVFLGKRLGVNTAETVVSPDAIFSRLMFDDDIAELPQKTSHGFESSTLVLNVFIRNSDEVKVFQRARVSDTFVKFDFDQSFNQVWFSIEHLLEYYRGIIDDERYKLWENWFAEEFDVETIHKTIEGVKALNLNQVREEFIQSLPDEFDRDIVRRKVEPYFELLRMTQTTINQDVARMYRYFTSVDLPPINQDDQRSGEDNAVIAKEVGGIDFTANQLNLEIQRDQNGLPIPLSDQQLQNIQIDGLVPVIIQIQPMTNLPLLMGASKTNTPESKPKDISFPRKEAIIKENEYASSIL